MKYATESLEITIHAWRVCWRIVSRLFCLTTILSMDLKKKVFLKLKTGAQAFGYKRDELMSVAAHIAGNLKLDENASEEEVEDAVDEAVSGCIPFLKYGQSMATRVINDSKLKDDHDTDDDNDDDDDTHQKPASKKSQKTTPTPNDEAPAWVKELQKSVETLANQVETMKGEKVTIGRKERLSKLLADTGTYGETALKNFERMSFKDDDDFDDFFTSVEADLAKFKQQMADSGLAHLTTPPTPKQDKPKGEDKVFTDEQLEEMASGL